MALRLLAAAELRFGSVVDLVRRACEFGAAARDSTLRMEYFRQAYRESANRDRRKEAHDPFVLPIETVKQLASQMQDAASGASLHAR